MVDITKCRGRGCDRRDTCYRYTAVDDKYWQPYSVFDVDKEDGDTCNYYMEVEQ
jgi:hypothetical protein